MSKDDDKKKAFEALGYIPEDAPKKPRPPSKPTEEPGEEEEIRLTMNSEDFETEFGPEAHRDDESRVRENILRDSLPSGPIKVLKLLFVDQVRDEYDKGGKYLGSKFIPQYIAVASYEITVPVLAYVKLKDGTEGGIPWQRLAAYEVLSWSKSKPE